MSVTALTKLFRKSTSALPWRITTGAFSHARANAFLEQRGICAIQGTPIRLKATRWQGGYTVSAVYKKSVQKFTPYSKRNYTAEKTTEKLAENLSDTEMLRLITLFETIGRGHKLKHDNLGDIPHPLDGATHIAALLHDPRILARVRPRIFAASRLRNMRKQRPHAPH